MFAEVGKGLGNLNGPRFQLLHPLGSAGRGSDEIGVLFFKLACMLAMLLVRWAHCSS